MQRPLICSVTLLTALTLAIPAVAANGPAPQPSGQPNDHVLSTGVVNVMKIFQQMHERKKMEDDLRNQSVQLQQEQQKREQELKDLITSRDQYKPGSGQWQAVNKTIDQKSAELEVAQRISQLQFDRFKKASVKTLYDHVSQAVAVIAQQQHLNLVIADNSPEIGPDTDRVPFDRFQQLLENRAVLFADKKADITEEVLTLVEANFAKQAQAGGTNNK